MMTSVASMNVAGRPAICAVFCANMVKAPGLPLRRAGVSASASAPQSASALLLCLAALPFLAGLRRDVVGIGYFLRFAGFAAITRALREPFRDGAAKRNRPARAGRFAFREAVWA